MKPSTHPVPPGPQLALALTLVAFLAAATVPYAWLIEHFGYDDILREPAAVILRNFQAGGAPLVLAWFGFSMSALFFVAVALGFQRLFAAAGLSGPGATALGIASAVAQAIGLLRWVLVVPFLAAAHEDPAASEATRQSLALMFDAVHRYGGMVIGEMVGQLLLAGWTAWASLHLWRLRLVPRAVAVVGLLTVPLWLVGQTELLHAVVPSIPAVEVIPLAFMAWEAWLAALALALLAGAWRGRARTGGGGRLAALA